MAVRALLEILLWVGNIFVNVLVKDNIYENIRTNHGKTANKPGDVINYLDSIKEYVKMKSEFLLQRDNAITGLFIMKPFVTSSICVHGIYYNMEHTIERMQYVIF